MKKLLLPLITLIIGFAAGYYFTKTKAPAATALTGPFTSGNSISQEEAQMLVDTFGMYGMEDAHHKPGGKGSRTRSAFIPLAELDSLCAALNAERLINHVTDGIRIYFGRYPKMQMDGKTPYEHAFHNTIILVSTKTAHVLPKGSLDSVKIHLDYFGSQNKKLVLRMFTDPQNRNALCPDDCDGATLVCPDPTDPSCTGCNP